MQAGKAEENQKDVATYLSAHDLGTTVDVCIVGCGPAGLALSAQVAEKGLKVRVEPCILLSAAIYPSLQQL